MKKKIFEKSESGILLSLQKTNYIASNQEKYDSQVRLKVLETAKKQAKFYAKELDVVLKKIVYLKEGYLWLNFFNN